MQFTCPGSWHVCSCPGYPSKLFTVIHFLIYVFYYWKKCLQVVFGEISCLRLFEWFWTSIILSVYRVSLKNIDKIWIFVRTMSINIWKKQEMSLGWSITNKYLHIPWSLSCQFLVILEELCLCNISFQNCTL